MRILNADEQETRKGPTANYPTEPHEIRLRIEHVLALYPTLNFTMLQVGLGTGFKPRYWRPSLMAMINEGLIKQWEEMRQGPTGRYNVYTFLSLSEERRAELDKARQATLDGQQET